MCQKESKGKLLKEFKTAFISDTKWVVNSAQVKTTKCSYQNKHIFLKTCFQPASANDVLHGSKESPSVPMVKHTSFQTMWKIISMFSKNITCVYAKY